VTTPACAACGAPTAPWISVRAGEPSDDRRYELARCARCGSAVTLGEPPPADAYETGVYAPRPPRAAGAVRLLQRATVGQPVRMLRRAGLEQGAAVLDAGAGRGRLVAALREAGYDGRGIEPSGRGVAAAEAAGLPVTPGAIESHRDSGLGAVVLWHVLEHLDEPLAALRRAAGWLGPGGLLLVAVPNAGSLQASIAGPGWLHWDAPRHRVHLTPVGVEELLARAGLAPVRTVQMVWEHNPAGMWMALLARLGMTPGFQFHLLKRNVRARPLDLALTAIGLPLAPAAIALEAGAAGAGGGGTIAVVARLA
jgi:SAM-dependent methyltransferase